MQENKKDTDLDEEKEERRKKELERIETALQSFRIEICPISHKDGKVEVKILMNKLAIAGFEEPSREDKDGKISKEWEEIFFNYVKDNLKEELKVAAQQVIDDGVYYACSKTPKGIENPDFRNKIRARYDERDRRRLGINEKIGLMPGRPFGSGEICNIETVSDAICAVFQELKEIKKFKEITYKDVTYEKVVEKLGGSVQNLKKWIKGANRPWESIKKSAIKDIVKSPTT